MDCGLIKGLKTGDKNGSKSEKKTPCEADGKVNASQGVYVRLTQYLIFMERSVERFYERFVGKISLLQIGSASP